MNHVNPAVIDDITARQNQAKADSRARKIIEGFYPFDTVGTYLIQREHIAVFMRYIPISKIDLDDIIFARQYISDSV